mgnify:CR=1 FL=1
MKKTNKISNTSKKAIRYMALASEQPHYKKQALEQ